MIDPDIKTGPRKMLVGNPLPTLAKVTKLYVSRWQVVRQQPFVFALKIGLLA